MRYFIRLLVPVLIFAGVVYLLTRQRRQTGPRGDGTGSDTGAFVAILALGAAVAIGTAFALHAWWE